MDTSSTFWGALASRKNIVGMVLAIITVVLHLVIGLGTFWPIIAAAAWGIGVALTPGAPATPQLAAPATLVDALETSEERFRILGAGPNTRKQFGQLKWTIGQLERHMDELAAQPILLQTVNEIAYTHLPTLEEAYAEVPDIARHSANASLDSSLQLLNDEAGKILTAIVNQKFRGLEDQRAELERNFSGVKLYLEGPPEGQ